MQLKDSEKKLIGGLFFIVVGAGSFFGIKPMYEAHEKRLLEIDKLVKELRIAHQKAENMSALSGEVDQLKYRLTELKNILPNEASSFELIEKIQGLAAASGVQIKGIQLEEGKEKGQGWKSEGLKIQFTGYWYQFIEFLWRIESYKRLIDITTVNIASSPAQPGSKLQSFTFDVYANVYSSTLTDI